MFFAMPPLIPKALHMDQKALYTNPESLTSDPKVLYVSLICSEGVTFAIRM